MFNIYDTITGNPGLYRALRCEESLLTLINCHVTNKVEDAWSHHNYIIYVLEGRKLWHTSSGTYDLSNGSCVFIRKGACVIEHFSDPYACFIVFLIPDDFIRDVLQSRNVPLPPGAVSADPVIPIENCALVRSFFHSMMPYFESSPAPDVALLRLKFMELILTMAQHQKNGGLRSYFHMLLQRPQGVNLQQIMDENFCFNLKLHEFARLCARSLSSFKRDFEQAYGMPPGKWLLGKRLDHARHLLATRDITVSDAAFESGFENASHFSRAFRDRFGTSPLSLKQLAAG